METLFSLAFPVGTECTDEVGRGHGCHQREKWYPDSSKPKPRLRTLYGSKTFVDLDSIVSRTQFLGLTLGSCFSLLSPLHFFLSEKILQSRFDTFSVLPTFILGFYTSSLVSSVCRKREKGQLTPSV